MNYHGNENYPISELRVVECYFLRDGHQTHYMHKSQVEDFVEAFTRLHHSPGMNPHNKVKAAVVGQIFVAPLNVSAKAMWWSTVSLGVKGAPFEGAAMLHDTYRQKRVWAHPDILRSEELAEAEEERWEKEHV